MKTDIRVWLYLCIAFLLLIVDSFFINKLQNEINLLSTKVEMQSVDIMILKSK